MFEPVKSSRCEMLKFVRVRPVPYALNDIGHYRKDYVRELGKSRSSSRKEE